MSVLVLMLGSAVGTEVHCLFRQAAQWPKKVNGWLFKQNRACNSINNADIDSNQ
jgi:hypothetical protein